MPTPTITVLDIPIITYSECTIELPDRSSDVPDEVECEFDRMTSFSTP